MILSQYSPKYWASGKEMRMISNELNDFSLASGDDTTTPLEVSPGTEPHRTRRRLVGRAGFWWVIGAVFLISVFLAASALPSFAVYIVAGHVFQGYEFIRTLHALGVVSWIMCGLIAGIRFFSRSEENPDLWIAVWTIVGKLLVAGVCGLFFCASFLVALLAGSDPYSKLQVLSPPSPTGCQVIYGVSYDYDNRADGNFFHTRAGSFVALWMGHQNSIELDYYGYSTDTSSDPITSGHWSLHWTGSSGTLQIQNHPSIHIDCS